jgi:thiamine-phosphate pyrophosphorylase
MRDDAAPGPMTPASAPLSGSPRNRQIPWGETAPGRLGREDARNFRRRTLIVPAAMAIVTSAEAGRRAAPRATILQLRAPQATARFISEEAASLVATSPVPVVISSRCDIAISSGAAGVHLPENDIPVAAARSLMGECLVGRSVHSIESALLAETEGADYVVFGPVWASSSHPGSEPAGVSALSGVAHALHIPVLAIGGVTAERIAECHAAGAAGYAAIGLFA